MNKKIGIMGGTFDPIHYGHLSTAETVRIKFDLDYILFVPTGNPPHKMRKITKKYHRYNMTILATISNDNFRVSTIELERDGYSYTVDTLKSIKQIHKDDELYFITGADAFCDMKDWYRANELFSLANFIGATRPGIDTTKFEEALKYIKDNYNKDVLTIHVPSLDISSTGIRKNVLEKKSVKYLIPENVERYIIKHNLYNS